MAAFEHRDHAGAKDIRDYLALWRADLAELERLARLVCAGSARVRSAADGRVDAGRLLRRRGRPRAGWILGAPNARDWAHVRIVR